MTGMAKMLRLIAKYRVVLGKKYGIVPRIESVSGVAMTVPIPSWR